VSMVFGGYFVCGAKGPGFRCQGSGKADCYTLTRTSRNQANHFRAMAKKRATLSRKARKGKLVSLELKQYSFLFLPFFAAFAALRERRF
jgi:hypothetical protein